MSEIVGTESKVKLSEFSGYWDLGHHLKEKILLKFIYFEKATKFCEISTLNLTTIHTVKYKVEISQKFVAFSKYMNFNMKLRKMAFNYNFLGQNKLKMEFSNVYRRRVS